MKMGESEEESEQPISKLKSEQWNLRENLSDARISLELYGIRNQYTIFKVPSLIRESDEMAYTPRQVSIGFNMVPSINSADFRRYKWRCVRYLLARHRDQHLANTLLNKCLDEMRKLERWLHGRCSFSHFVITGHDMIMDGCFILHLLLNEHQRQRSNKLELVVVVGGGESSHAENNNNKKQQQQKKNPEEEPLPSTEDQFGYLEFDEGEEKKEPLIDVPISQVKYDLLLLENQFPFLIIQKLFDVLKTQDDENIDLVQVALDFFQDLHPLKPHHKPTSGLTHHHLLHLFHQSLLPQALKDDPTPTPPTPAPPSTFEWIPSAKELQEAGVKLRRKENANIFDISFTAKGGILEVPPIRISNDSNIIFRNLMAFEHCFPVPPYVTAYALFMNCLVHTPDDARLLHQSRIVENATDEQVAGFFDRLCANIQYPGGINYLLPLYIQVGQYYESKWHKWRANLLKDYFGTPWVAVSVMAATILLVLTIMQTYYTAYPFYHPSN